MLTIEIALYFLLDIPIIILTVSRTKRRFIRSTFIICIYGRKQKVLLIRLLYLMYLYWAALYLYVKGYFIFINLLHVYVRQSSTITMKFLHEGNNCHQHRFTQESTEVFQNLGKNTVHYLIHNQYLFLVQFTWFYCMMIGNLFGK